MVIASVRPRPEVLLAAAIATTLCAVTTLFSARPAVAGSAATPARSLPANPPVDARAARLTVVGRTLAPKPTTTRGFNGYQTVTIAAPAGKTILQGFATLSGGQTGSVVIESTRTVAGRRFVVQLVFPGTQGTPGKLQSRCSWCHASSETQRRCETRPLPGHPDPSGRREAAARIRAAHSPRSATVCDVDRLAAHDRGAEDSSRPRDPRRLRR